jgi:hypothetical protein
LARSSKHLNEDFERTWPVGPREVGPTPAGGAVDHFGDDSEYRIRLEGRAEQELTFHAPCRNLQESFVSDRPTVDNADDVDQDLVDDRNSALSKRRSSREYDKLERLYENFRYLRYKGGLEYDLRIQSGVDFLELDLIETLRQGDVLHYFVPEDLEGRPLENIPYRPQVISAETFSR